MFTIFYTDYDGFGPSRLLQVIRASFSRAFYVRAKWPNFPVPITRSAIERGTIIRSFSALRWQRLLDFVGRVNAPANPSADDVAETTRFFLPWTQPCGDAPPTRIGSPRLDLLGSRARRPPKPQVIGRFAPGGECRTDSGVEALEPRLDRLVEIAFVVIEVSPKRDVLERGDRHGAQHELAGGRKPRVQRRLSLPRKDDEIPALIDVGLSLRREPLRRFESQGLFRERAGWKPPSEPNVAWVLAEPRRAKRAFGWHASTRRAADTLLGMSYLSRPMATRRMTSPARRNQAGGRALLRKRLRLLKLAEKLGNVRAACDELGYSRDSYYRFLRQYDEGGEEALLPKPRAGVPNLKNRVSKRIENAAVRMALSHPEWGQITAANVLATRGYDVSASAVRKVWIRRELATKERRLAASLKAKKSRRVR